MSLIDALSNLPHLVNYLTQIEVILYTVSCMIVSGVYLYFAWSKSESVDGPLEPLF
jgi:hypothetical protein